MTQKSRLGLQEQMTPMIDVIFQLLIFFLCTAGFVVPEAVLPTELPATGLTSARPRTAARDADPLRISVQGAGQSLVLSLNGQPIDSMAQLLDRLAQLGQISAGSPVILDVGPDVAIGPVIDLYDGTLTRGFSSIHFAADRPPQGIKSP
jgi:biopolymer transport protein ExbD